MTTEIMDRGERKLALYVGRSASGRSLSKLAALRGSPGWIVAGNTVNEWKFDGFLERDEELYLQGPYVEGRSLESILPLGLQEALPSISRLAGALALLSERMIPLFPIQTDSVIFRADGGVLFLPPETLRELRGLRSAEDNLDVYERINHPELNAETLASFSIAALLYRISTGRFPFEGGTVEQVHEEARKRGIPAPDKAVPGLSPDFSGLVMSGLGRGNGGKVGLSTWKEKLEAWRPESLVNEPAAEEKDRIRREAAAEMVKADRKFKRAVFIQKNGVRTAVIAGIVIIVGLIVGQYVKNLLAPRVTHGFAPEKVVETFYRAMSSFDHATMSSCVTGQGGSGDITETTTMFVFSRVTMGYEGRSSIVGADEWDKAGRPELQPMLSVYGVTDLALTQERGQPEPVFMARYVRWRPIPQDASTDPKAPLPPGPYFEGKEVTDRVYLKLDHGDWAIYNIERNESATP
jgi:hypothetical protein